MSEEHALLAAFAITAIVGWAHGLLMGLWIGWKVTRRGS
jgi:hypothetical protein